MDEPCVPPCETDHAHGPAYAEAAVPGPIYSEGVLQPADTPPYWGDFCRACFDRLGCALGEDRGYRYPDGSY